MIFVKFCIYIAFNNVNCIILRIKVSEKNIFSPKSGINYLLNSQYIIEMAYRPIISCSLSKTQILNLEL